MKKALIGFLFLCGVIWGYWHLINTPPAEPVKDTRPVVKIGIIYPQSGDGANFGAAAKNTVEIFTADLQKKNPHYNYQFIWEDNQLKLPQTVSAAQKLIGLDKVDVLITCLSNHGQAVSPIAEKNKVLHFSVATDPAVADGKYNFIVATSPERETQKLVNELLKRRVKKIDAVIMNAQGPALIFDIFKKQAEKNGIKVNQIFQSNAGERDYRLIISKINDNKPDIIMVMLQMPEIDIFLRQLQQSGSKIPFTGIETFSYLRDKSLAEGMYYVDAAGPITGFIEKFQAQTGNDSTDYGEYLYAVLQILTNAYEALPADYKSLPSQVSAKIIEITGGLETAIGPVNINKNGVVDSDAVVKKIQNGKAVVVEE